MLKYGTWNITGFDPVCVSELEKSGISTLTAAVLASRGLTNPEEAHAFLSPEEALLDPMMLQDMDCAVSRLSRALEQHESICVYGDYDVDGITATCLLSDYLESRGGTVRRYIPNRLEEGYGLNTSALAQLAAEGTQLIVTVDCGITATEEALFCKALGVDLIITDHHECKEELPEAVAVINPNRLDSPYPHGNLAGVGVAFKLAAAMHGSQSELLRHYCDLLCLGTVADVMPLLGENRCFVSAGLKVLQAPQRPGVSALIRACGCEGKHISATTIGYTLSPRINAAGRMGQVELAMNLFLTKSPQQAEELAESLYRLNRQRQQIEQEIYADAVSQLDASAPNKAIVLASESWHQGVVGIVASRLAEEYRCPTFLICLDGEKGKASSRSHGGFNLFAALDQLSDLLDSFGGHEQAAGFTIHRSQIDAFRDAITAKAAAYYESAAPSAALQIDCEAPIEAFTLQNVADLAALEPCGSGCPSPVFCLSGVCVEQMSEVGGGKHLRLRLGLNRQTLNAIFFSNTAQKVGIGEGDLIDIAFIPQVNTFRGLQSVQFVICDIRPDTDTRMQVEQDERIYLAVENGTATCAQLQQALPQRSEFVAVWKYLTDRSENGQFTENYTLLSRNVARFSGLPCSLLRTRICLDVFHEQGLLELRYQQETVHIRLTAEGKKTDLKQSNLLRQIRSALLP